MVSDADSVTVSRVRVTGAPTGFPVSGVKRGRLENCVSDHNNFGIAMTGGAVVNCTIVAYPELGLSLANGPNAVAFNNCIVDSASCLSIDVPENSEQDMFELHPGKSFWIGYFIDDNDTPFTDVQP